MRRFFILFSLVILSISAYAIDKQVLADSLTAIVHQHAFAGKVDVSRIRVKNQYVHVYTNATLSHISLTPKEVSKIRMMVSKMILGNKHGKGTISRGDYELCELITND